MTGTHELTSVEAYSTSDVPEGWAWSLMRDISRVVGGGTPSTADPENFSSDGFPWITPADLSGHRDTYISRGKRSLSEKGLRSSSAVLVPPGTVVFSSRAPIGYVAIAGQQLATSQGCRNFVCQPGVLPEFVYYYLRHAKPIAEQLASGTTFLEISGTNAGKIPIPLPPLAEQRRIVVQVEALLAHVGTARERLAAVSAIMKRFRQSVLAAACSGRLSEDWRADPPHVPLDANGSGMERAREHLGVDVEESPEGWVPTTLGKVMKSVTSGSRGWAKYYSVDGPLFIRAQDINADYLRLDDVAHVNPPAGAERARTRVSKGDLLVTITGANVTRTALVGVDLAEAYVSQHVALVRLDEATLGPFLHLWLTSPAHGRDQLLDAAYGAGKPGLNLDNLRAVTLLVPPAEEREEIVRRVGALLRLAHTIELRVAAAGIKAEQLGQKILAKAFSGELAPTNAGFGRAANFAARQL